MPERYYETDIFSKSAINLEIAEKVNWTLYLNKELILNVDYLNDLLKEHKENIEELYSEFITNEGVVVDLAYRCKDYFVEKILEVPSIRDNIFILREEYRQPTKAKINVPSGKIIMANDFRRCIPSLEEADDNFKESINSLYGEFAYRKMFEENGVLSAFVGNTCPHVVQKDNEILIGNWYDGEWKSCTPEGYSNKGSICTDVWHFMAMDLDLFNSSSIKEEEVYDPVILEVEPGEYEVSGYYHIIEEDAGGTFASIKKVN